MYVFLFSLTCLFINAKLQLGITMLHEIKLGFGNKFEKKS